MAVCTATARCASMADPSQSRRNVWGVVGYLTGWALAFVVVLLISTTFEVGVVLGASLTLVGFLLGRWLAR